MKQMNHCHIIIILLAFVTIGRAQSGLRKPGIYEVDDTLIEVYNWKEPFAIREFKTINGTDVILFREFNGLTKKIKQEGMFKGGYSSGTWKFYGWTGRLKKEIKYDNMVKTFYSKKTELTLVDFDFEKYKSDSLFVYNYRKQKKENALSASPKSTVSKNAESTKGMTDSTQYKANAVLAETAVKKESGQKSKAKEMNPKKDSPKNAIDSLQNKRNTITEKEPLKEKKDKGAESIVKTADVKKEESPQKNGEAAQTKQKAAVAAEPVKSKNESATETKTADAKKTETQKKLPDSEPSKQPALVVEEPVKSGKENATSGGKPASAAKAAPPANPEHPEQNKQKPVAVKEPVQSKKENNAVAEPETVRTKTDAGKKVTGSEEIKQKPVEETVKVKQEQQTDTKIKTAEAKKSTTDKNVTAVQKNKQDTKQVNNTENVKKENTAVVVTKTPVVKEMDSTNYKANALLVEEYARSKNVSVPVSSAKPVNTDKVEPGAMATDPDKNKAKDVKEKAPAASNTKQNPVAGQETVKSLKETKETENVKSAGNKSVVNPKTEPQKSKPDSLKLKKDTLQPEKNKAAEKKLNDVNVKTTGTKK